MKIIYGITKSNFGGAQRYVYDLARGASAAGHNVAVMLGGVGILKSKLEKAGIRTIPIVSLDRDISLFHDFQSFSDIYNVLMEEKPDVFHSNSSKMGGIGGLAARLSRVKKVVFTSHGWAWNEQRPRWQKRVIKIVYWVILMLHDRIICVSDMTRRHVSGWVLPQKNLVVIRNGIEEFEIVSRAEARERLSPGTSADALLVGTMGELHWIKGQDVLLDAWSKFARDIDAKLVIMGTGEREFILKSQVDTLGIGSKVIFTGYLEDARSLLSGLDIFVLPSRSENLPYAILEAGKVRLPVTASAVGGIPEIIKSRENGFLVTPNDPSELLAALMELKSNVAFRELFGIKLKATVESEFTLERMLHATLDMYK